MPGSLPPLGEVWELAQANLRALPERYRALTAAAPYPVRFSDALQVMRAEAGQQAANMRAEPTKPRSRWRGRPAGWPHEPPR